MKIFKKLFKHGGSHALVIPAEFMQYCTSGEVFIEFSLDENNEPSLVVTPLQDLDARENDSNFALFMEALYQDALENPNKLKDASAFWNEDVAKLIKGVEVDENEE